MSCLFGGRRTIIGNLQGTTAAAVAATVVGGGDGGGEGRSIWLIVVFCLVFHYVCVVLLSSWFDFVCFLFCLERQMASKKRSDLR